LAGLQTRSRSSPMRGRDSGDSRRGWESWAHHSTPCAPNSLRGGLKNVGFVHPLAGRATKARRWWRPAMAVAASMAFASVLGALLWLDPAASDKAGPGVADAVMADGQRAANFGVARGRSDRDRNVEPGKDVR
jgi:hypothetical protein